MLVRVESVAKSDHSSLVIKVPDVNLILFDDRSAVGSDDYGKVNQSHHHVAALQESLGLKPLKIKSSQRLKEFRNLREPSSWLKPGHTRVQRAVFPFNVFPQVTQDSRNVSLSKRGIYSLDCLYVAHDTCSYR